MTRHFATALGFILQFVAPACYSTTYVWPGSHIISGDVPCPGSTLTDCVTATSGGPSDGDTIVLAPNGPIDESLDFTKSISLRAAPTFRPVFAAGRHIQGYGSAALTLDGIILLGGYINIFSSTSVAITHVDLTAVPDESVFNGGGIYVGSSPNIEIAYNIVHFVETDYLCGICTGYPVAQGIVSIHDNRVFGGSSTQFTPQIGVSLSSAGGLELIYANQLYGVGVSADTRASAQGEVDVVDNASICQDHTSFGISVALAGSAATKIYNNTIAGCGSGITVTGNTSSSGVVSGNIVANTIFGMDLEATATAGVSNDHNLVFNNSQNTFTPGPNTITADPKFARTGDVRLSVGSPAIDAADPVALITFLNARSMPAIDADGLRRFKGAASVADLGAFEYGDTSFSQKATGSETTINLGLGQLPQMVQNLTPDGYPNFAIESAYTGFLPIGSHADLIREDTGSSPVAGSTFNIFVPAAGGGQLVHTSSMNNVMGFATRIDDVATDEHPERIVIATLDSPVTFNHPFATAYLAGHWYIEQLDAQSGDPDFPSGIRFNVYAQDPSLNAFKATAPAGGVGSGFFLDHPVLNDEPCSRFLIGNSVVNPHPVDIHFSFSSRAWEIENADRHAMLAGAQFPVIVDEAGTSDCRYDHLFHNGFDPYSMD